MVGEGAGSRGWLKMIQKCENEGRGAGLVYNMNGGIWIGRKVGGECI